MKKYDFLKIEKKWQNYWEKYKTFKTKNNFSKKKFYILDMFPYPSGKGLHVGHPEGYTASDIIARYKRMKDYNVLHPMGWDAFGLPAEQFALEHNIHPKIITKKNIDNFRKQIKSLGFSYDWDREINTTDPNYYRWTQWIFIQLYKKKLAYIDDIEVNWCPELKVVLANEEVIDGKTEKGHKVVKKPMRQWILRISHYAERLLEDLEELDWPEGIKEMQRNWIGKSIGAELKFQVADSPETIWTFTTRPDTIFGATYIVLAPEHQLVKKITTPQQKALVDSYCAKAKLKTEQKRKENKEKTGIFTGAYAINPVNQEKIPIWVSDYVLISYGTGSIMSVPSHDERDFEFAQKMNLNIRCIIEPKGKNLTPKEKEKILTGKSPWTENGLLINSNNDYGLKLNGLNKEEAKQESILWFEKQNLGRKKINYRLRDWIFSRQRYWGEPFPIVHYEDGTIEILDDNQLPLKLPQMENFTPSSDGQSPLANNKDWVNYTCPKTGRKGKRETNTMPQWAGSCWYYLRYIDPLNSEKAFEKDLENYWMPVDLYIGGAEHAVLHLLYARFWHKVLYDIGIVSTKEPFKKLFNQGMILGISYKTSQGFLTPLDQVLEKEGKFFHKKTQERLECIPAKMSKSLKNIVNPDDIIEKYGADSLRLYEMFMGPLEATKPWNTKDIEGVFRFLQKVWKIAFKEDGGIIDFAKDSPAVLQTLHQTIKKVSEDIENLSFNTAISQMMILSNQLLKEGLFSRQTLESFIKLLAPFAPHISEEIWQKLGYSSTIAYERFPIYNPEKLIEREAEILIQILGKPIKKIFISNDISKERLEQLVLDQPEVRERVSREEVKKIIIVPRRLINIVI